MNKLIETLEAVKDPHLSREQLDDLHMHLSNLVADLKIRVADLKKKKALYILASQENSQQAKKDKWDASEEGQRLITYIGYLGAVQTQKESVRSRIYALL